MPYITRYIKPEIFCKIDGVSIYHLYRDGTNDCLHYEFSTTSDEENIQSHFDVRDLVAFLKERDPNYQMPLSNPYYFDMEEWTNDIKRQVITSALRAGLIPVSDEFAEWLKANFEEKEEKWRPTYDPEQNFGNQPRGYWEADYNLPDDLPNHEMPDG